jgi:aminopeptidase YwaD
MKSSFLRLLAFFVLIYSTSSAQKLKKADRTIVSNIQTHINYFNTDALKGRVAGSDGEKLAGEYIIKQLSRWGVKARGTGNSWYQPFEIYDGKEVLPSTHFNIDGNKLELYKDFFPLAFSANKGTDAIAAIALAENGVPWFKDMKEIMDDLEDGKPIDTLEIIRTKAIRAAKKGATAFVVYNTANSDDLEFDRFNRSATVSIPVLYLKKNAYKKYCSDESASLELSIEVALEIKKRTGNNLIGYADNGRDSTIIINAHLDHETDVAGLIEIARLLKSSQPKSRNYLFVTFSGEQEGLPGKNYFQEHATLSLNKINYTIDLDTLGIGENPKGLNLVKHSIEIIKNH